MKLRGSLGKTLNPALLGRLAFILFSIALVGGYFVVSYQQYLKTYQTTQHQEIETAHQKMDGALRLLKELLGLSGSLISTTIPKASLKPPRLNQEDRLREILNTVSLLKPPSGLPSLQKVAFYKFSPPQMVVTRFGTLPFVSAKIPVEKLVSRRWDSELMVEEKAIVGRVTVGKPGSTLEGVLEIQVNLAEFKRFLGTYQTIRFDKLLAANFTIDKNHFPFYLGKTSPPSFRAYALTQAYQGWFFMGYFGFSLLLLGMGLYLFNGYAQKSYRQAIDNLEEGLLTAKKSEKDLKTTLSEQKKIFEVYTTSQQAQKSFCDGLAEKQKSQVKQIVDFLESAQTSHTILSRNEKANGIKLEACLKQAHALSNGLWKPVRADTIDLKNALKNLYLLFADKVHQSNIHLEIGHPPDLPLFKGDSLLIDMFLMNIVGKAIYRVPDNGAVTLSATEASGFLHLKVEDTGYGGVMLAERLIQQSFSLFMEESAFKRLCNENGVYIKYSKSPQGLNITQLVIPLLAASEEGLSSNVVRLFP